MRIISIVIVFLISIPLAISQKKVGLMIGISDYQSLSISNEYNWPKIHGVNDVDLISETLSAQGYSIKKLTDKNATAQNIRAELSRLAASSNMGDYVYIHFSCHGQPIEDLNNDEDDGWDESIIPYDAAMLYEKGNYEGANHIVDDELSTYFSKLRESIGKDGLLCVVIDACHAGSSSRSESDDEKEVYCRGVKRGFSPSGKNYYPRINAKSHFEIASQSNLSDVIILEACRSYQTNYEISEGDMFYGALSYYINKTLSCNTISPKLNWVYEVKQLMDNDIRLIRQNMVYETTLKE